MPSATLVRRCRIGFRISRRFFARTATGPELYDLIADPAAAHNLAGGRGRVVDGMSAELEQFIRGAAASSGGERSRASTAVPPEVAQRLAALGYVGGSGGAPAMIGVDPKDRVALANSLHAAIVAVEDGAFATAIPLLERVVREQADLPIAQLNLGIARARQRQWAQAIPALIKAAALQPDTMIARYELGVAYYETGDLPKAAREFEAVVTRLPEFADARYSLGSVYARIDRVADAIKELRAALAIDPRHFRANLLLGRILTLQNQTAAAIPHLRTATEVDPRSAEAQSFLADAYEKAGNAAEAAKARQRARDLARR
jgi:tetratricopeptide (TPR) repeat protein